MGEGATRVLMYGGQLRWSDSRSSQAKTRPISRTQPVVDEELGVIQALFLSALAKRW
jgi:hypothetical protein